MLLFVFDNSPFCCKLLLQNAQKALIYLFCQIVPNDLTNLNIELHLQFTVLYRENTYDTNDNRIS